jgi:hypothetical protein
VKVCERVVRATTDLLDPNRPESLHMADELTPDVRHDDDRIRELDARLDQKLEALNLAARELDERRGEPAPTASRSARWDLADNDDVAVLRPIGRPEPASPPAGRASDLVASYDDEQLDDEPAPRDVPEPVHASWSHTRDEAPAPRSAAIEPVPSEEELQFWAHTRTALRNLQQATDHLPRQVTGSVTDEVERIVRDELGAPTSTLRLVQQHLQQGLPRIAERIEEALREELVAPNQALREIQDDLPARVDRLGRELGDTVREDLERVGEVLQSGVQRDVAAVEQAVATNVTRMATGLEELVSRSEQSLGADLTKLGGQLGGRVERIDSGLGDLGRTVDRSGRELSASIEQVEERLRAALADIEGGLRGSISDADRGLRGSIEEVDRDLRESISGLQTSLASPLAELPGRIDSVERRLVDEVHGTRGDLGSAISSLTDASQASLDRLAGIAAGLDDDRTSRAQDVELVVDTFTTGWEGLASAMQAIHSQNAEALGRLEQLEERVGRLADLEQSMTDGIANMNRHISELKPAPVVVSVHHPDADVRSETRGGWLVDPGTSDA